MDDWRLTVDFDDEGDGTQLVEWLAAIRFETGKWSFPGGRVAVSRSGPRIYLYADDEASSHEAERLVRERLADSRHEARISLERWHPIEQAWEDAAVPLPRTEEEVRAEHERQQAREAIHSRATGHAEWEVRVSLPSREATEGLAERLEAEGFPIVRRATFLLVGAVNHDQAEALAERLRADVPEGAAVEVEPGGGMVWEVTPRNPFAIFGGLGT